MLNKVILIGRVGKDAELFGNENPVAKFSLATSERYKNKNGEVIDNTEWHNIIAFGKLSETVSKYVSKGMLVSVEGKIQTQKYEKDGITHYQTQIIANSVQFLSRAESSESDKKEDTNTEEYNDDLPF